MRIKVKIASADLSRQWNQLVKWSRNSSVFHLWEWGDVLCLTHGFTRYYLVAFLNGEVAGVFPLILVRSYIFGNKLVSTPFCEYGGPIVNEKFRTKTERILVIKKLLKRALRLAEEFCVDYIDLRSPTPMVEALLFDMGFKRFRTYVTFQIDLRRPVDIIWKNLNKKTRNAIRKAVKKGVSVRKVDAVNFTRYFYSLYLKNMKRLGSPPESCAFFKHMFALLDSHMFIAKYLGEIIGAILLLTHRENIYWYSAVVDDRYRYLNPTNLLLWRALEWGSERGFDRFIMGRTRKGTGVYMFKSRWGGKEVRLTDYAYFLTRVRKPADPYYGTYYYLSKVWSKLPCQIAMRVGPIIRSMMTL